MPKPDPMSPPSEQSHEQPEWINAVINWLRANAHTLDKQNKLQITIDRSGDSLYIEERVREQLRVERGTSSR